MKRYRQQPQQPLRGSSARPAAPQGRIIDLAAPGAPLPIALVAKKSSMKRTRSITAPKETPPGLAIHVPESMSRPLSRLSNRQNDSLQQLQKIRLELLGERKQQLMTGKEAGKDAKATDQQSPAPPPHRPPLIPAGAIPVQSPYALFGAGDLLQSPLVSCLSTDLLEQINDSEVANKATPESIEVESLSVIKRRSSLSRSKKTPSISDSILSRIKKTVVKPAQEEKDGSSSTAPAFDIQKSLDKQLAMLPGSRLPGTSTQSFDEHSYILASGTDTGTITKSSSPRRLDEVVSVLPCESFTPSPRSLPRSDKSQMEMTLSKASKSRSRSKRILPPTGRADTVRIDKGLSCVDPNNLKPQMQEILQKKNKQLKGPVQQVGKIVEAFELVENSKRKGVKMVNLGNKLKHMVPESFTVPFARSRGSSRSKSSGSKQDDKSKSSSMVSSTKDVTESSENSDDERLWVKETIKQENYKITKVLGAGGSYMGANDTAGLKVEPDASGIVSEVLAASESSDSGKQINNMEIILAAEGKKPMFKVPYGENESPKELALEDKEDEERKKAPMKGLVKLARRLKQKERLTSLVRERLEKKEAESLPKYQSEAKPVSREQLSDLAQSSTRPRSTRTEATPSNSKLNIDTRPSSPTYGDLGGSFCLATPTLENNFSLNGSITDVARLFAQDYYTRGGIKVASEDGQDREGNCESKKKDDEEKGRTRAEAMKEARVALMFSLKHRIVSELKKQKMREIEAAKQGETISDEENIKQLETVRRLHLRREALQHLSDEDFRKAFNDRLQRAKAGADNSIEESGGKRDTDDGDEDGGDDEESDPAKEQASANSAECDQAEPNRKHVSFASHTNHKIISKKSTSLSEDIRDDEYDDYDDSIYEYDDFSRISRGGFMSWAQCGLDAADIDDACGPIEEEKGSSKTLTAQPRSSNKQAQARGLSCAPVPESASFDSESTESKSSNSGTPNRRRDLSRKSSAKTKDSKSRRSDTSTAYLSNSGSRASHRSRGSSFETRDTRDTRRSEYTEDTRDTYDTRETPQTRDSSYYTYDSGSRNSYASRSVPRYRKGSRSGGRKGSRGGSRSYASNSLAETDNMSLSEYTEDTFDTGVLRCGRS